VYIASPVDAQGHEYVQIFAEGCVGCTDARAFSEADGGLLEVFGITTDSRYVYWLSGVTVSPPSTVVMRRLQARLGDVSTEPLVDNSDGYPVALAVDDRNVYWLEQSSQGDSRSGTLYFKPSDGRAGGAQLGPTIDGMPEAIALAPDAIYWTVDDNTDAGAGSVWGIAKPLTP